MQKHSRLETRPLRPRSWLEPTGGWRPPSFRFPLALFTPRAGHVCILPVMPSRPSQTDLDLHGRTSEQALGCVLEALSRVEGQRGTILRVIHGKGTYALATDVERLCQVDPRVDRFERDPMNDGVTLLYLNNRRLGTRDSATRMALGLLDPPERRRRR